MAASNLAGSMILSMIATAPSEPPGEKVLKGLHQILMLMLLESPGQYRECEAIIFETNEDTGLTIISRHAPAPSDLVGLMANFFDALAGMWASADALDIAAFAVWAICWIHPFTATAGLRRLLRTSA
jgi:Fic family protein